MQTFKEWLNEIWLSTGGVVNSTTACMYLNVSVERVNQIWKQKKYKRYIWEGDKRKKERALLSFRDVIEYDKKRRKNGKQTATPDNPAELSTIPKIHG